MKFFHANVVFSAVIVWFAMPALGEGVLSMGTPSVDGTNVTVPVYLQGDINEGVAALDFTLQYDPSVLAPNGVRAGESALAADKGVQYNMTSPGNYVVMMFGLNQSTMATGKVADISFRRVDSVNPSETNITIGGTTLASLTGQTIPSQGSTASFQFDGTPGNEPDPTDPNVPAAPDPNDPNAGEVPDNGNPSPAPGDDSGEPTSTPDSPVPTGNSGNPVIPATNGAATSPDDIDNSRVRSSGARTGVPSDIADAASRLSQLNRMAREFDQKRAAIPSPPTTGADSTGASTPASAPDDAVHTSVVNQDAPVRLIRSDEPRDARQLAALSPSDQTPGQNRSSSTESNEAAVPMPPSPGLLADRRLWALVAIIAAFVGGFVLRKRVLS